MLTSAENAFLGLSDLAHCFEAESDGLPVRRFQGLKIVIENPKGSTRSGKSKAGKAWSVRMAHDYGFIKKAVGADGEGLDVFLGPHKDAVNAYVIHQNQPATGRYDEDKVMLGFHDADEAKAAYLANYNTPKFFRSLTIIPMDRFKKMLTGGAAGGVHWKQKHGRPHATAAMFSNVCSLFAAAFEENDHPRAADGKFALTSEETAGIEKAKTARRPEDHDAARAVHLKVRDRINHGDPDLHTAHHTAADAHQIAAAKHRQGSGGDASKVAQERSAAAQRAHGTTAPAYPARADGEADKQYLKRVANELPDPAELPEDHEKYFNMEGATAIPLDKLVSAKTDAENAKGGNNAPKFMRAAYDGKVARRDPITVTPMGDGRYKVTDGNGTFTGVKKHGWKSLPVIVGKEEGHV